jgi:hypothetical protein
LDEAGYSEWAYEDTGRSGFVEVGAWGRESWFEGLGHVTGLGRVSVLNCGV